MTVPKSPEQQLEWQLQCYGCYEAELTDYQPYWNEDYKCFVVNIMDAELFVMSILSDVQEMMLRGNFEMARQYTNRAKWVLGQLMYLRREMK